jgi:hypothetical protein
MSVEGLLLAVWPDGQHMYIANEYESIRRVFEEGSALFDVAYCSPSLAFLVDDEGLLNGSVLNTTASWFGARAIYGPVVVISPETGPEGETLPAEAGLYEAMTRFASQWRQVWVEAESGGQDLSVSADPDNIPPPQVIAFEEVNTFEDFLRATSKEKGQ